MNPLPLRIIPILPVVLLCQCGAPQPPQCRQGPEVLPGPRAAPSSPSASGAMDHSRKPVAQVGLGHRAGRLQRRRRQACSTNSAADPATGTPAPPPSAPASPPPDERQANLANLDAVFPASQVELPSCVNNHKTTDGVGVPLVGWKKTSPVGIKRATIPAAQRTALQSHRHPRLRRLGHSRLAFRQTLAPG